MADLSVVLGWFGVVAGIASILVSFVLYKRAERIAEPVYVLSGRPLAVSDEDRGIAISYKGTDVDAIHQLLIVFWNAGRAVMRGSDVPEHSPLRFVVPEGVRILDAAAVKVSNSDIRFSCSIDEAARALQVEFHHLGEREGALMEVLHTGGAAVPRLEGTVVGAKEISEIRTPLWDDPGGHRPLFAVRLLASVLAVLLASAALVSGTVELVWWAVGALTLATFGHFQAIQSFRQDVRYLPEAIRPPPYNRLLMSRENAERREA